MIPGENHNLQTHAMVMVRGGRVRDRPGVNLKVLRGVLDASPINGRKRKRSNFEEIRAEFLTALPNLNIVDGYGDRLEWKMIKPNCTLTPVTCSVVQAFYPFSRRPWAAKLQDHSDFS